MSYEFNSIPPGEKAKRWQRIHNAQAILSAADFPGHVLSVFYGKIALWEIWDLIEGKIANVAFLLYAVSDNVTGQQYGEIEACVGFQ